MSSAKSSGKRYFWWRLRNDFFTQITIKKLRRSENGDKKAIIYLQMILMTIHQDGYLRYDGIEDDISEEIALYLNEPVEVVQDTIEALKGMNLIEIVEDDFFLPEAQKGIGSECSSAERMRRKRARDKEASQSDNDVTQQLHDSDAEVTQALRACDVEKSREENRKKEIEINKEKEREEEKNYSIPISDSSFDSLVEPDVIPNGKPAVNHGYDTGEPQESIGEVRVGKESIGKESIGEVREEEGKPLTLSKTSGILFEPEEIVQLFNSICTEYKPVTDKLSYSQQLSDCVLKGYKESDYIQAFKKAEASDYLKGLTENKSYPSDFGWILEHLEEIKSGKYDTYRKENSQ